MGLRPSEKIEFVVFHPGRLIFPLNLKSGSTTIIDAILQIAGIGEDTPVERSVFKWAPHYEQLAQAGIVGYYQPVEELINIRNTYSDYCLSACVRNPYDRIVSGYRYRYRYRAKELAREFRPEVYRKAKLQKLFGGKNRRNDASFIANEVCRNFSFSEFLRIIERDGTSIDPHFSVQSDYLGTDRLEYDCFLKLEHLGADFSNLLKQLPLPREMQSRTVELRHRNPSVASKRHADLTPQNRKIIEKVYAGDFAMFGYTFSSELAL